MHFLHRYRDLTILSIATQPAKEVVTQDSWLPCWVPDWRQSQLFGVDFYYSPIAYNGRGSVIISLDANFDASLGLKATPISLEDDEQVLCLNGITADTIEAVGDVHLGVQQSIGGVCRTSAQWKKSCAAFSRGPLSLHGPACVGGLLQNPYFRQQSGNCQRSGHVQEPESL